MPDTMWTERMGSLAALNRSGYVNPQDAATMMADGMMFGHSVLTTVEESCGLLSAALTFEAQRKGRQ